MYWSKVSSSITVTQYKKPHAPAYSVQDKQNSVPRLDT